MSESHETNAEIQSSRRLKEPLKPFEVLWDDEESGVTLDPPDALNRSIWTAKDWLISFRAWNFKVIYALGDLPDLPTDRNPRLVVTAEAEVADGSVEVLGTRLRTRNFQLQLRGFDPDKATTNFAGGDTCELKTPSKPRHSIDVELSMNYQKQFKRSEPTAALGFNKADEDDRYGPEEPATWWVTFHVPYEILETLIVAIKTSRCREFIVGGQFVCAR
jgi:hypothetical protein